MSGWVVKLTVTLEVEADDAYSAEIAAHNEVFDSNFGIVDGPTTLSIQGGEQ